MIAALVEDVMGLGFLASETKELVTRLSAGRHVIDLKRTVFSEKPETKCSPNRSPEAL